MSRGPVGGHDVVELRHFALDVGFCTSLTFLLLKSLPPIWQPNHRIRFTMNEFGHGGNDTYIGRGFRYDQPEIKRSTSSLLAL